jgi:hypothetical protein
MGEIYILSGMPRPNLKTSAVAGALLGFAVALPIQSASPPRLHSIDLLDAPKRFVNQTLDVDIVEPISGYADPTYGQLCVEIPEAGSCELALVTPAFKPNDPDRYKHRFDQKLTAPVHVRGEFLSDDDLARQTHLPAYVIRVSSAEAIPTQPPEPVASVSELLEHREHFDRRNVVIEGTWETGFEKSTLDEQVWLSSERGAEVVGTASPATGRGIARNRVRVIGLLFARPNARYGHLGSAKMELRASRIEYLGPAR